MKERWLCNGWRHEGRSLGRDATNTAAENDRSARPEGKEKNERSFYSLPETVGDSRERDIATGRLLQAGSFRR